MSNELGRIGSLIATLGLLMGALTGNASAASIQTNWYSVSHSYAFEGSAPQTYPSGTHNICYRVHLANVGWSGFYCDGSVAGDGTHRIEAIQIYSPHLAEAQSRVEGWGWTSHVYVQPLNEFGSTGQNRGMFTFAIETPYDPVSGLPSHTICGREYMANLGWMGQQCARGKTGAGQPHGIIVLGLATGTTNLLKFWLTVS